jgi:hypothetical protein
VLGHVGFLADKVALGQAFSDYFGFPCQFSFQRLIHLHHHLSSGAGTIGQTVADVPSGLSLTPPQETNYVQKQVVGKKPAIPNEPRVGARENLVRNILPLDILRATRGGHVEAENLFLCISCIFSSVCLR